MRPAAILKSVDLPEPLGPRHKRSPAGTESPAASRSGLPPKVSAYPATAEGEAPFASWVSERFRIGLSIFRHGGNILKAGPTIGIGGLKPCAARRSPVRLRPRPAPGGGDLDFFFHAPADFKRHPVEGRDQQPVMLYGFRRCLLRELRIGPQGRRRPPGLSGRPTSRSAPKASACAGGSRRRIEGEALRRRGAAYGVLSLRPPPLARWYQNASRIRKGSSSMRP